MQTAPGHEFTRSGVRSEAVTARIGAHGNQAVVEVVDGRVGITPTGKHAADDSAFGLRTVHVGRLRSAPDEARVLPQLHESRPEDQEAVLARNGVEERYLAGPLGLEQSYRIEARPGGAGPLALEIAFDGLAPRLQEESETVVALVDAQGRTRAVYRDLVAVDAGGRELVARMEVGTGSVTLVVDDEEAAYPVEVDPLIVTEQGKLLASDGERGDWFGRGVGVSGDTVVIGAPLQNAWRGAVYVFVRSGTGWTEQAKLIPSDSRENDWFGISLSISGDTLLVGAPSVSPLQNGAAYVFVRSGTTWSEEARLLASNGAAGDQFGAGVTVSGDTAVVSAPNEQVGANTRQGSSRVFVRTGTTWSEEARLTASDGAASDQFGTFASLSGDTLLVGVKYATVGADANRGRAYVFARSGTAWSEEARLTASDGSAGDFFGNAVTVSGSIAVVGSPSSSVGPNTLQGSAYVFVRNGPSWVEEAKLTASDGGPGDVFGRAVSLSGTMLVVGAPGAAVNGSRLQGAAYSFVRSGTTWTEEAKITASDGNRDDGFAWWVSSSGTTAVFGTGTEPGSAYVNLLERPLGVPCSADGDCLSGFCADGVCCDDACAAGPCEACSVVAGAPGDGLCVPLTGHACDDGDACTQTDSCLAGVCFGADPVPCNQCRVDGACDPSTGLCASPSRPDGTSCEDGDACTQTDACQAGNCVGGNAVVCAAGALCLDPGTCDTTTGQCSEPMKPDGSPCDDLDACTLVDGCVGGACAGSIPISCSASNPCHDPGICDPSTGVCSNPAKPDGAACDDADACTRSDSCLAGSCVGRDPVVCVASDQCHDRGSCDPPTGACSDPARPDGAECSDGDGCSRFDACQAGICVGADPLPCTAGDQCHDAGACDPATGACSDPPKPDGISCDDDDACTRIDVCEGGACTGLDPVVCGAGDQCHDPGRCDPSTGECSDLAKPDGTACSDGDACTEADSCDGGACTGGSLVLCEQASACHEAGSCDPATGACSYHVAPDGSLCDDGDGCTNADRCAAGVCAGTPVVCEPLDECHDAGGCVSWTGTCLNPSRPDGARCSGGSCTAGVCTSMSAPSVPGASSGDGAASDAGCGCGAGAPGNGEAAAATWLSGLAAALARAWRRRRA